MTQYAITEVELDRAGEVQRGAICPIAGGIASLPSLDAQSREILDRVEIVDLIEPGDDVFAMRGGLPPDRVRVE